MENLLNKILLKLKELKNVENEKEFFNNISIFMFALNKLLKTYSGFNVSEYEKEFIFFENFLELNFNEKQKPFVKSYMVLKKGKEENTYLFNLLFSLSNSFLKINGRYNEFYFGKEKLLLSNKDFIKIIFILIDKMEQKKEDIIIYIDRDFKQILENIKKK